MEEADKLWDYGSFLLSINYYGYRISLYSLGTDFYEVYYDPDFNCIVKIKLAEKDDLKKYLNRIELDLY